MLCPCRLTSNVLNLMRHGTAESVARSVSFAPNAATRVDSLLSAQILVRRHYESPKEPLDCRLLGEGRAIAGALLGVARSGQRDRVQRAQKVLAPQFVGLAAVILVEKTKGQYGGVRLVDSRGTTARSPAMSYLDI